MGDVVNFKERLERLQATKDAQGKSSTHKNKGSNAASPPPDRDSVLLWQMAQDIDDLVRKAVLEKNLAPAEVAAILAHRLGTLISVESQSSQALSDFCCRIIRRIGMGDDSDSHAG